MISLNWVSDYVDITDENINELTDKITKFGVNIEQVINSIVPNNIPFLLCNNNILAYIRMANNKYGTYNFCVFK